MKQKLIATLQRSAANPFEKPPNRTCSRESSGLSQHLAACSAACLRREGRSYTSVCKTGIF
eukprot:2771019-Amphidinium_carterae.1